MKTNATITGPKGKVTLVYGIYGLKNFCKRLGCEPTIISILPAFQGGTQLEAITEIVRSGMEQAAADRGEPAYFSDYEACEVLETATKEEGTKATHAFFSSIVGEDYETWLAKALAKNKSAQSTESEEGVDEKKSDPTPAGKKSSGKPTES